MITSFFGATDRANVRTVPQGMYAKVLLAHLENLELYDNWDGSLTFWGSDDDWEEVETTVDAMAMAKDFN